MVASFLIFTLLSAPSSAETLDPVEVSDSALDDAPTGFSSTLDSERLPPATTALSAAELVRGTPGVALRSLGGIGDFTTLSIRGATSTQVGIYLDGAPLTQPGVGTVDLATVFLLGSGRLVLHRGFAPLTLGPEAFAGALELRSERPRRGGMLAASYGSFAARELAYLQTFAYGEHRLSLAALYFGKAGDFPYLDDRGTPLVSADDALALRRNNDLDALFARVEHRLRHLRSEARVLAKAQGAPAPVNNLQDAARYALIRPQLAAAIDALPFGDKLLFSGNASALATLSRFSDLRPSLYSPATEQETRELSLRGQARLGFLPRPWLDLETSSDLGGTGFFVNAPGLPPQQRGRLMAGGALVVRARALGDRLEIEAGSRLDGLYERGTMSASIFAPDERARIDRARVFVQPSAGVRFTPWRMLSFGAHLGRRERAPTFYELFGTDGQIRGNPLLEPEAQWSWDAGVRALPLPWLSAELVYAESRYERLITFIYAGLDLPRAENIGAAIARSLEASLAATPARFVSLSASYTFQPTRNETAGQEHGRPLAGRPRHQARAEIAFFVPEPWRVRVSVQALTVAGLFLDQSGRREVPPRVSLDAQLTWNPGSGPVFFQLSVRNLLDQRTALVTQGATSLTAPVPIVDFLGFPLPGRSFSFTLIYAFDERAKALGESLCIARC